ncbi:MAG: RNA ligase family protein, partial [Lactococcus garvieae]
MKFEEFQSLVNENPKSIMPILRDPRSMEAECTVTEKIHGTNFGIWWDCEAQEVKFSKRTSFIGEESNFFNWQQYFTEDRIKDLTERFKTFTYKNYDIKIYGELFGGGPDYKCKPVQREID